jgi:hypothetical protein
MGWTDFWPAILSCAALIAAIFLVELVRPGVWHYLRKRPYRYAREKRKPPPRGAFHDWRIEDWLLAGTVLLLLVIAGSSISIGIQSAIRPVENRPAQIVMSPEQLAAHDRVIIEAVERKVRSEPSAENAGYALTTSAFGFFKNGAAAIGLLLIWLSLVSRRRRDPAKGDGG